MQSIAGRRHRVTLPALVCKYMDGLFVAQMCELAHTHTHKDNTLTTFPRSLSSLVFPRSLTPGSLVSPTHSRPAHEAQQEMHTRIRRHVHPETRHIRINTKTKNKRINHTQRRASSSHTLRFDPDLGLTGGPRCEQGNSSNPRCGRPG